MPTAPRPVSRRGPSLSTLVAGLWRLKHWGMSDQQLLAYLEQLRERGVTTFDHAMVYGSEAPFGRALALKPSLRCELEIITKCGIRPAGFGALGARHTNHYDSSREAIVSSAEASLRALGTDYLDILLLHRPDYLMRGEEVAEAFCQLQRQGKVRYFGVSNFNTQQFALLQAYWPELVTNQVEFSPCQMAPLDNGVFEQCALAGVRPMLWSCLAGGQLFDPGHERGQRVVAALKQTADELGWADWASVVYAWALSLSCEPLPLLGTSKIERVDAALRASQQRLTREQWYRIWEAANGAPVP